MEKQIINVEGMTCEHCVNAITKAVKNLNGIKSVSVNLNDKTTTVEFDSTIVSLDKIKEQIRNQDYEII